MEMYLGSIIAWPINYSPQYFMYCAGQLLNINNNQALYSLLGTYWGGSVNNNNFALPDLRGRVIMGATSMGGGNWPPGVASTHNFASFGGNELIALQANQVPLVPHVHTATTQVGGSFSVLLPALSGTGQLKATAQPGSTNIPGSNAVPAQIEPLAGSGDTVNAYGAPDNTTTMPVTVSIPAPTAPIPVSGSPTVGVTINSAGQSASQYVPLLQPYVAMNYIICTNGLYPARN
jgi:microcystin-dependent protein